MYGPIRVKQKDLFVHELCAVWTPEIYFDSNNKFKNMNKALKRCLKINCSLCKERGGGLGCFVENCKKSYHYLCALASNCFFVHDKFLIYCEDHRNRVPEEDLAREMEDDEAEQEEEKIGKYTC